MTCLKDMKISEMRKLKCDCYYVQSGMRVGMNPVTPARIITIKNTDLMKKWKDEFLSYDEHKVFTTKEEAEEYIKNGDEISADITLII